jgi:hypothetical protein
MCVPDAGSGIYSMPASGRHYRFFFRHYRFFFGSART